MTNETCERIGNPIEDFEILAHVNGGQIYLSAVLDQMMIMLVANQIVPEATIAKHLNVLKETWAELSATPGTPLPNALQDAQGRLESAMQRFQYSVSRLTDPRADIRGKPH